jgi:hypothetical protein
VHVLLQSLHNRLDPFFGNSSDPQSFHKYGYVHGDPIQMIDPTGEFGVVGLLIGAAAQLLPGPGDMIRGAFEASISCCVMEKSRCVVSIFVSFKTRCPKFGLATDSEKAYKASPNVLDT